MRNFKKVLLVVSTLILSGCVFTGNVWNQKIDRDEVAKDLLISSDGTRLVVLGKKYDYFLNDDKKMIQRLFQSDAKQYLIVNVDSIRAKGEKIERVRFLLEANEKNLSQKQNEFMRYIGAKKWGNNPILKFQYPGLPGFRTTAGAKMSEYKSSEFTSTGFIKSEQKTAIFEDFTPLQKTGKVLITPFTLAADIVLLPLTIPMFIYHQIRESQTPHFCEGEFCGYDKLPKQTSSQNQSPPQNPKALPKP